MHDTAFRIGSLAMNIYADLSSASILEVGSRAFNGSLRDNALPTTNYVGLDLEEGDGVDVVAEPGKPFPVEDEAFDLVMASSVFEHDPMFWVTFVEMCKKTKNGGYIYVSAPSNGIVHRYPQDNWRFYPDAANALIGWAVSQGQHVSLVETFTAGRDHDIWNDFVAVFRKGQLTTALPRVFIHEHVPSWNVMTWKSPQIFNLRDEPEDMVLLGQERARVQSVEQTLAEASGARDEAVQQAAGLAEQCATIERELGEARQNLEGLDALRTELHRRDDQLRERKEAHEATQLDLASRAEDMQKLSEDSAGLRRDLSARENERLTLQAELELVRGALAARDSELRQRQEEIEQTRNELVQAGAAHADMAARVASLEEAAAELGEKLVESESWVFKLAGKRRAADQAAGDAEAQLERETKRRLKAEAALSHAKQMLELQGKRLDEVRADFDHVRQVQQDLHKSSLALISEEMERSRSAAAAAADRLAAMHSATEEKLRAASEALSKTEALARDRAYQVEVRYHEIATMTDLLRQQEEHNAVVSGDVDWLRSVSEQLRHTPRWWGLMSSDWRRRRERLRLRRAGVFDDIAYLERYPDVVAEGMDPLEHYILHGIKEGRSRAT